jgi:hypothetical protein
VLVVAGIEVAKDEFLFRREKGALKKAGFTGESFYESRFVVNSGVPPAELFAQVGKEFGLEFVGTTQYTDHYLGVPLPSYSGRTVSFRLRSRGLFGHESFDHDTMHSLQVVYTRSREEKTATDQVRYFPSHKEKWYLPLEVQAHTLDDLVGTQSRATFDKHFAVEGVSKSVYFDRMLTRNNELALCTDTFGTDRGSYVVELKVWSDKKLLKEAMRYVMVECPVSATQTTHGKSRLVGA